MMQQLIKRLTALEHDVERLGTIDNHLTFLPVGIYTHAPFPFAASGSAYAPWTVTIPRAGRIVSFILGFYVGTTNNATNYWTFTLREAISATTVVTMNTSASSANTWTRLAPTTSYDVTTSLVALEIVARSTLAPGNLWMSAPIIAMR